MSPAQALPLAMIGTAIILWPILGRLQFRSTVQPEFRLAGNFPHAPEQDASFHLPDRAERPHSSKEQSASNSHQHVSRPSSQVTPLNGQARTIPLTSHIRRRFLVPHIAVLLLVAIGISLYAVARLNPPPSSDIANNPGPPYGLSIDGSHVFDLDRPDAALKQQAAHAIAAGDSSSAEQLLHQALLIDSSDAEALIYLTDLNILASHRPYVTVVVTTTMDPGHRRHYPDNHSAEPDPYYRQPVNPGSQWHDFVPQWRSYRETRAYVTR
jgi:hypothetical protein